MRYPLNYENPTLSDRPDDEEWDILEPVLIRALYGRKRISPPRLYPLREIVNTILFVLVAGCP